MDLSALDPIVLAPNVVLTEDQKAVTRLSSKFTPTPRTPMDIADLMVGLERFAEHLRWHQFLEKNKLEKSDNAEKPEEAFDKPPWYQPTGRAAPRGDDALEAFISAIRTQALDQENRRKTRDNLTPGQRKALVELRNLPVSHKAACRSADKSSVTVITSLEDEDRQILEALKDPEHYTLHQENPNDMVVEKVQNWVKKWESKGKLSPDIATFAGDVTDTHPGKCKPLIKTHKPKPYPIRLLLSGCGTPVEPLSKIVQRSLSHFTDRPTYQVIDTKEFLTKIETINKELAPLPDSATLVVCDVVALYPNVNNDMGVPTVDSLLTEFPSNMDLPKSCVLEALDITLNNNFTQYTDASQTVVYAKPSRGTAMGPSHACDYVDIFMSQLDEKLTTTTSARLLTSLLPPESRDRYRHLDWSRFRDDGLAILPDATDVAKLEMDLSKLHPPNIKWVLSHGIEAEYLDLKLKIENGYITTDVFSKSNHSYLPPSSCHSPSTFRGLIAGVGTRLRMLCSDDSQLDKRIEEYAGYFSLSGWNRKHATRELRRGANKNREDILHQPRKRPSKKIAWLSTYDPRLPSKNEIIKQNLDILYSNPVNRQMFPKGLIIAADRRRQNLGEIIKPTVPNRFPVFGPKLKPGFHPCGNCDTCNHSAEIDRFKSPWDGRTWRIRQSIDCRTPNVIYCLRCMDHPDELYIGSTVNLRHRWANHKSDCKLGKGRKCQVAQHFLDKVHTPVDKSYECLQIFAIEAVYDAKNLGRREVWWQLNVGTFLVGLNSRSDIRSLISGHRTSYKT